MVRNVAWKEPAKSNTFKLLEALLSLADGWELDDAELKLAVQAEWCEKDPTKLRVTGKSKKKTQRGERLEEAGTTKKALWQLAKKAGKCLELPKRQQGEGCSGEEREAEVIQTVIDCLEALGVLKKEDSRRNQGFWKFTLTLKCQTVSIEENLAEIKRKWQEKNPEETTPAPAANNSIDWHTICRAMLEAQPIRRQATGRHGGHEIKIHVPLGLVKPSRQAKRDEQFSPMAAEGTQQYRLSEKEIEKQFQQDEFFTEVINKTGKNLAIIGEPGAGKSTWISQIAKYLANPENSQAYVICIPLGNLQGMCLETYLRQFWLKKALPKVDPQAVDVSAALERELVQLFNSGNVWLLLDGADEMSAGNGKEDARSTGNVLQQIANQLTGWVAKARVVLSCRLNVWEANDRTLSDFETYYRTLHFKDEQVQQFIHDWFQQANKPELGKDLQTKLAEPDRDRIRDLVKNPLRLSLLCETWDEDGDLPETKALLYQRFREAFYRWKKDEFPITATQKQSLNQALARLALTAIERKMPLRESLCYEVMGEAEFQLAREIGWLNYVYNDAQTDEPVYAFYHLTFQEYFAALAVENWHYFLTHVPDNPQQGIYHIFEPQWREVILLWLGRVEVPGEQKEEFISALVEFEEGCRDFYGYQAYFLAAAGITEFRQSSKSEEIVRQIVKWGFGEFNIEKQQWQTYLDPIEEAAREVLPQTQRSKAINALVELIGNCGHEETRRWAAESLGKIDPGNETAIAALVDLTCNCGHEFTRWWATESLGNIGTGNETAINALVDLTRNSGDEDTRRWAAESLGNIGTGSETAINALVELIRNDGDEDTRRSAAETLRKIDPGNETAINALVKLIGNTESEETRRWAAESLGKIDPDNETAINALVQLIGNSGDVETRYRAVESLGNIGTGNETAINALVKLIGNTESEETRYRAAESLGNIGTGNETAINALVELIGNTEDEFAPWSAAESLGNIGTGNETAINALVELMGSTESEETRRSAAESLGNIDPGNKAAINALVELIGNTESKSTRRRAAESLKKILVTEKQMVGVAYALKDDLSNETYKNDFDRFEKCYEVIWHCAQTLPYPTFYEAWHHPPHTPHPEVAETTGVGFSAGILQRNLAELPQRLKAALVTELIDSVQLICIDGSSFFDKDNPILEIYDAMLDSGCPEHSDGSPKKIAELKLYYKSLCRNGKKRPILLFYENPAGSPPQGFSEIFLNALSKFDGSICVVSDQVNIPLQSFSPNQPNLIEDIVGWIRRIVMES